LCSYTIGQININPATLANPAIVEKGVIDTLMHEMLHILGFSSNMYSRYKDASGNPYQMPVTKSEQDSFNGFQKSRFKL
jgi:hypothetical protein